MDPIEHTGPVIDSGAEIQQTRSISNANTTTHSWLVDTCDGTGSGASPRPTSGIAWPRQGISLDIGEASGGPSGPIALNDLTDVDTQTAAATDGQALVWDTQTQIWKPGTVSGGTFRIQDAEDFELNDDNPQTFFQYTLQLSTITATGQAYPFNTGGQSHFNFSIADANGLDIRDEIASGATLWIVINDAAPLVFVSDFRANGGSGNAAFMQYRAEAPEFDLSGYVGGELVKIYSEVPTVAPKQPLADGDILRWNGQAGAFKPAVLNLDELDDVQAITSYKDGDTEKPFKTLIIDHLNWIQFKSFHVPEGEQWGMYANEAYGPVFGRYEEGTANRTRADKARRTYYDTNGIIHNLGNKPLWLNGALGTYTDNTPELRWTSGNPGDTDATNDGNFIGLKLPADITTDTTYTFPLVDGTTGDVLRTDGAGALSWVRQEALLNTGGVPITYTPGLVFNFEGDGNDTPTPAGNAPPSFSADAAVGTQSLLINTTQADAQYLQGTWPASPFGNANHIGTQAFTFQTYFRNLNPELPGTLTRYHRMFSAASNDGTLNQVGGFQVRTGAAATSSAEPGAQGAMELFAHEQIIRGSTPITDDAWHHLCIQHDGLGNYVIFLDGAPDGTAKRAVPYDFLDLDGFIIGGRNDQGADTFWMGHLDAMELVVGLAKYPATGFTPPTEPAGQDVTVGSGTGQLTVISDLNDVDTETTPPTDGQALVWSDADQEWQPGTVSGGSGSATVYSFLTGLGEGASLDGISNSWSYTAGTLRLSSQAPSGNLRAAVEAINPAGDIDFWISSDNGGTWQFVAGGANNGLGLDNPDWVFTNYPNWIGATIDPASHAGGYLIALSNPNPGSGRATGTATAATLANAAAANLEITALGSAGMFLKVTTSHAAWVRFYADATTRAADTRTDSSVPPTRGSGVLLEVISTGAESFMVTPAVHYFQATPTSGTMHVKVTNQSGAEADIQVDVEALVLES